MEKSAKYLANWMTSIFSLLNVLLLCCYCFSSIWSFHLKINKGIGSLSCLRSSFHTAWPALDEQILQWAYPPSPWDTLFPPVPLWWTMAPPLTSLPLIGLKLDHLGWCGLVTGAVLMSELFHHVHSWRGEDRAMSGQPLNCRNRSDTTALCHNATVFGRCCIEAAKTQSVGSTLTWFHFLLLLLPWKSVAYVR